MRKQRLPCVVLIGFVPLSLACGCAASSNGPRPRTIAVVGHGVVKVKPDTFLLTAGISYRDKDLDKATTKVREVAQRVMAAVNAFPVDESRTHTRSFRVSPESNYQTKQFLGYDVWQGIDIYLCDLSKNEQLTVEVLRAGATNISIDYLAEHDREALVEQAKEAAVRDARRKAEKMAAVLGERVGRPLQIGNPGDEWDGGGYGMFGQAHGSDGYDEPPTDSHDITWIAPSQVEVEATIFVRFALVD